VIYLIEEEMKKKKLERRKGRMKEDAKGTGVHSSQFPY
jgi:hypothetical protein